VYITQHSLADTSTAVTLTYLRI